MSYLTAVEAWIVIASHAHEQLTAEQFGQWLTLVGGGDDFDRCRKGEHFYQLITGETAVSPIIEVGYERSVPVQTEIE